MNQCYPLAVPLSVTFVVTPTLALTIPLVLVHILIRLNDEIPYKWIYPRVLLILMEIGLKIGNETKKKAFLENENESAHIDVNV